MAEKELKVGVWRGAGLPPGYRWTVLIPDIVYKEATSFLTSDQYCHASEIVKDLAQHDDPTRSNTQRVEAIRDFHELKDKGGILGNINLRIYFYVDTVNNAILLLGAINKKTEGQPSNAILIRMARRLKKYQAGEWKQP